MAADIDQEEQGWDPPYDQPWDVVVVGGGAAGLMACLELPAHMRVLLLSKERKPRSASRWAQLHQPH
jgi:L-aspartate oxidase